MKSTGIVRRIDDLGRVMIPKEIRRTLRIQEGDPLEIYMDEDGIVLKRYDACDTAATRITNMIRYFLADNEVPNSKRRETINLLQQAADILTTEEAQP